MTARYVVAADVTTLATEIRRLESEGRSVRRGWEGDAEDWDLGRKRVVHTGTVSTEQDARRVVLVAAQGAELVILVDPEAPFRDALLEDLGRLGQVEVLAGSAGGLAEEHRQVLELAAAGASQDEIAKQLFLSRRTVARRLAEARSRLGAATTAEAIQRLRGG